MEPGPSIPAEVRTPVGSGIRPQGTGPASAEQWLDQTVYTFRGDRGRSDWTVRDAIEGLQIFGATGSGKTSGSGRAIATSFLKLGFGGLVLTSKPDEVQNWVDYFEQVNRPLTDLIILEPQGRKPRGYLMPRSRLQNQPLSRQHFRHAINLIDYEFCEGGGLTPNVVSLLLNAVSVGNNGGTGADPFWHEALRELLTHAIDLVSKGTQVLTGTSRIHIEDIIDVVRSAPYRREEAFSESWRDPKKSRCWELLNAVEGWAANADGKDPGLRDMVQTGHYWLSAFPALADRTRSIVVSSLTGKVSGLIRSPLCEFLCEKTDDDARPEVTHRGKVIVLNIPVKLYGEVGRIAQILYKTIWQRATERRIESIQSGLADWKPVFLWADESQYFVAPEDMLYQQTARSAFASTVYLTQSISNYYAELGGRSGAATVDALLGNLQTKIFHANGDAATNQWAERIFGSYMAPTLSSVIQSAPPTHSQSGSSSTLGETWQPRVPAARFTLLPKGGPPRHLVRGIVFQPGHPWGIPGQNHLEVDFVQSYA